MHKFLLFIFGIIFLSACGESYTVPRATFHIDLKSSDDAKELSRQINEYLVSEGFEDLGIYEEMIDLFLYSKEQNNGDMKDFYDDQIQKIKLERNYANKASNIDVQITDYSDPELKKRYVNYPYSESPISDQPSIEVNIHNMRPGGFSADALNFYDDLTSYIRRNYDGDMHIIFSPPASNQKEFYRISTKNLIGEILNWLIVFTLSIAIFGLIVIKLLKLTRLRVFHKRVIFSLCTAFLSTPLPFPAAPILTILLPSVFAFTAIGTDYFSRIAEEGITSFSISITLCVLISVIVIKDKKPTE